MKKTMYHFENGGNAGIYKGGKRAADRGGAAAAQRQAAAGGGNAQRGALSGRAYVAIFIVLLVALGMWWWLGSGSGGAGKNAAAQQQGGGLPVEVDVAREGPIARTVTVVGQLVAHDGAALKSEVSGRVVSINFSEGKPVKKGQLLIKLDDGVPAASLAQAQADLGLKRANVGRYTRLLAENAASKLQLDQAKADAKLAEANVAYAKATLDKYHISAPFDGVAGIAQVNVGELVQPGDDLVAVTDNDRLKITFKVPESEAAGLRVGLPVQIITGSGAADVSATVEALDGRVDPATRTMQAKVVVDNRDHALLSGQFVRVVVPVESVADAVVIPDTALVPQGDKNLVWVVGPDNHVSSTAITVGIRAANRVQVLAGLEPGARVVVAGQQKIQQSGMPVTPLSPTVIVREAMPVEQLRAAEDAKVQPAEGQSAGQPAQEQSQGSGE